MPKGVPNAKYTGEFKQTVDLNRKADLLIYGKGAEILIGKANRLIDGGDVTLIAEDSVCVPEAIRAADALKERGIFARLIDMETIKPLDAQAIRKAARETRAILNTLAAS